MDIFWGNFMKVKAYHFKYSHFRDRIVNGFFSFCANFATPIIMLYIILMAMALTGINKYLNMELLFALLGFSILLGIIMAIKFCFGFKGIVLYDSYLEIITQTIGLGKNRPKFKINYSDIASAFNGTFNLRYDRKKARRNFLAGDLTDYIELTLKGGKQFCFTVENQSEFLSELITKLENAKNDM